MTELEIILTVYREFITRIGKNGISIDIGLKSIIGTVQDDPFDNWIELEIKKYFPKPLKYFILAH